MYLLGILIGSLRSLNPLAKVVTLAWVFGLETQLKTVHYPNMIKLKGRLRHEHTYLFIRSSSLLQDLKLFKEICF